MAWSTLRLGLRACLFSSIVFAHGLIAAAPAAAELVVAIEANPGVAVPGEQLEVRITVANQGPGNVAGVLLNLLVPAELDIFQIGIATPGAGGCTQITNNFTCQVGETLIWNLGTIVAGQSVTTSLTPIVSAGALGPIVFNPVLNSGPSASATVTLNAGLTLDVSLHELADPVAAGDDLAYTLHFGNRSTINTAPNALLRLPLPAGTTFVSASDGGVLNAGAVEWSLGTLQPGQSGTRNVTLETGVGLVRGASILANAELSDTTPQLARARALTEIDGLESLELAMVVGPDPAAPGEQLEIELTVSNPSALDRATVSLVLRWPHQIDSLATGRGTSGRGGCVQIVNDFFCTAGEFAAWNLGTLDAGQSITVTYSADLAAGAPDGAIVDFRATVLSSTFDDRTESGRAIAVDATSMLDVALHEAADPIAAGDDLAYTLHFGNRSTTDPAPNALLRLPLPAGTTFVSASDGGVLNVGTVEWSLGTLAPGQSGTRSVTFESAAGLVDGNLLQATATLSDTSSPPQLARVSATTEIDGLEALELALVVGPDPAAPGEQLGIELTVSNRSASNLSTVTLLLRWPQEIDSLSTGRGTSGPGGCVQIVNDFFCTAGEFATWNLGTLNAGQSITVSYSADLAAGAPDGAIVDFQATVLSSGADDRARAGRAIAVDASSALEVALHEAADPIAAGDDLVYTISYINTSLTNAATDLLLRLPLPVGTSFVGASGAGVLNGDTVEWSLGTLQPGKSGTRNLTVQTEVGLVRGAQLRAEAALSDSALPPQLARASASTEIDGLEALETTVEFTLDHTDWAWEVDVTVTNTDVVSHTGVGLTLRVPRDALTFPTTGGASGCTQIVNNFTCEAGEFLAWNLGTLTAGQSVTVTIPNLYIVHPTADLGELFTLHAIALGSGVDDRAVDQIVPEPGIAASLFAGMGLLAGLTRWRCRSGRSPSTSLPSISDAA